MYDDEETYRWLVERFPHAERADLIDALNAAQTVAVASVVGPRLLVREVLHGAPPGRVARAEGLLTAMRADASEQARNALRRAADTNGAE